MTLDDEEYMATSSDDEQEPPPPNKKPKVESRPVRSKNKSVAKKTSGTHVAAGSSKSKTGRTRRNLIEVPSRAQMQGKTEPVSICLSCRRTRSSLIPILSQTARTMEDEEQEQAVWAGSPKFLDTLRALLTMVTKAESDQLDGDTPSDAANVAKRLRRMQVESEVRRCLARMDAAFGEQHAGNLDFLLEVRTWLWRSSTIARFLTSMS
jgi:hypothetical protein